MAFRGWEEEDTYVERVIALGWLLKLGSKRGGEEKRR